MTRPMHPSQAREVLRINKRGLSVGEKWALETVAAMTVQEDWRLADPFTNGGKYEKERWARLVSEWVADE